MILRYQWNEIFISVCENQQSFTHTMTHRKIRDGGGQVWDVWEVYPSAVERRMSGEFPAAQRTDGSGERREIKIVVPTALQQGWLAFQSGTHRRRLTPIPEKWGELDDAALAALLERASKISDGNAENGRK
jgi:hypothetical protein